MGKRQRQVMRYSAGRRCSRDRWHASQSSRLPRRRAAPQRVRPARRPLAPANLAKPRPKPPFNLTGTWFIDLGNSPNSWRFGPPTTKLTPQAQVHFDASRKAQAEGKAYRDDIGQCWPAGLPLIMTRVWPIAMVQLPTAIYMVSHFMNSLRIIYLDAAPTPIPTSSSAASTASPSGDGKGTLWSSTRGTSSTTTTGSMRARPPATPCASSSALAIQQGRDPGWRSNTR